MSSKEYLTGVKGRCWCEKPATAKIVYNLGPDGKIITYTCAEHKCFTVQTIKFQLIMCNAWIPENLTVEPLTSEEMVT